MAGPKSGFEDKFLSKLGKIDPRGIRDYLSQLLSRKQFFETIFDHLGEGIMVTDEAQRIVYTNRFARGLLQWRPGKQYLGEPVHAHCPEGEVRQVFRMMAKAPRPIEAYECSFDRDQKQWIQLTAFPIASPESEARNEERTGSLWVFLLSDVTERRRRVEEQARAQRLASLSMLTSGVAHEIKNPLNSLNIHAQILLEEARAKAASQSALEPEKAERAATVILEETDRLTRIIDEFIEAARPQQPRWERKYIDRIIEDLERLFEPECAKAGIQWRTDLEPELPPLRMDGHQIFQALRNLVRNAIDALTAPEATHGEGVRFGRSPMIMIRTRLAGDHVAIEVIDNGPGIREDHLNRIFEPYFTTKPAGTGLGLMVVYRIISEHQGSISVESRVGVGSRFTILLPLAERVVRLLGSPQVETVSVAD